MANRDMRDTSAGDWLRRLPQYLYVADLIAGKRVLEVGCGTGAGSKFLADHGAAKVVGIDAEASAVDRARRVYHRANLSFRHESLADMDMDDGGFDCVFVPDGMTVIKNPPVLRELRRVLAADGHLVLSVASADRAAHAGGLSYYEVEEALSATFAPVRMVAQTPFVAMSLVEYGDVDEGKVVLDTSLVEWSRTTDGEVVDYLAVCGGRPSAARGFTIVQLPTRSGVEVVGRSLDIVQQAEPAAGRGALVEGTPGNLTVSAQIAEALSAHAQNARELERKLAEQRAYNDEVREELELVQERADSAEQSRQGLADKLAALQDELKTWRSKASIAEGEAMRLRLALGEDLVPGDGAKAGPDAPTGAQPAADQAEQDHGARASGNGSVRGSSAGEDAAAAELAALREEMAETQRKLERVTGNWREAEAKNDAVWRRVGELQNELEQHREQAVARSAQARRSAQLSMAKAMESASAKLVGVQDQLLRCERRCEALAEELNAANQEKDELARRLEQLTGNTQQVAPAAQPGEAATAPAPGDE